jgi:adenosylcobinamide-GDP ribazoletransferase
LLWLPFGAMTLGLVCALTATIWLGRKLQKWLGGYTGDCLGAVQQLSEVTFYMGVLTVLR